MKVGDKVMVVSEVEFGHDNIPAETRGIIQDMEGERFVVDLATTGGPFQDRTLVCEKNAIGLLASELLPGSTAVTRCAYLLETRDAILIEGCHVEILSVHPDEPECLLVGFPTLNHRRYIWAHQLDHRESDGHESNSHGGNK
jgi:hypothetical protein